LKLFKTKTSLLTIFTESNFYREEDCAEADGYCVLLHECPDCVSPLHRNLCYGQKKYGAICCTSIPVDQLNCYQRRSVCLKSCKKSLALGRKGCPKGTTCCVMV
ncbi:uncharacterized protein BDFB_011025, partial [Asbolus verrucosus]